MIATPGPGRRYLGIHMGSDAGKSACVSLVEDTSPEGQRRLRVRSAEVGLSGQAGVERLEEHCRGAVRCAVDSPLGLPGRTLALLNGHPQTGSAAADAYRYRTTDLAMRARLRELKLSPSYVSSPLRQEALRRTLQLLERTGEDIGAARQGRGALFETHSRVALVELLTRCHPSWDLRLERQLIADCKRSEKKRHAEAEEARRTILFRLGHELNLTGRKGLLVFPEWRAVAAEPAAFDALFCAFAALAMALGTSLSYPAGWHQPPEVAGVEGWAFAPDWPALLRALGKDTLVPAG